MNEAERKAYALQRDPRFVIEDACKIDSVNGVRRGFDLAATKGERYHEHDKLVDRALDYAVTKGAVAVTGYLLSEHPEKPSLEHVGPYRVWENVSIAILDVLLRHGWDINQRSNSRGGWQDSNIRLLNLICNNDELMNWALDHGATVSDELEDNPDRHKDPYRDWFIAPSLLDSVASSGSLEMLKHLYALSARPERVTLHHAARRAAYHPHR